MSPTAKTTGDDLYDVARQRFTDYSDEDERQGNSSQAHRHVPGFVWALHANPIRKLESLNTTLPR